MRLLLLSLALLLTGSMVSGQRLYIPPQVIDSNYYKHYVNLLMTSHYNDSVKPNNIDKSNKWIAYYQLNS